MKLAPRALSLFPFSRVDESTPKTLQLIASYAAQNPGLEFRDYCSDWRDVDGRRAYFAEMRAISKDLQRVRVALSAAIYASVTDADILEASQHAFSGRLTIEPRAEGGFRIDYCTGQYWPTEYRKACASVLESATRAAARKREALAA